MARIDIDTGALRNAAHAQAGLAGSFEVGSGVLSSIAAKLDWEFEAAQAVEAQLKRLAQRLRDRAEMMRRHSHYLEYVAEVFERAEASLLSDAERRFTGASPTNQSVDSAFPWQDWIGIGALVTTICPVAGVVMMSYGIFGGGERQWGDARNGGSVDYWGKDDSGVLYGARTGVYGESGPFSGSATGYLGKVDGTWNPFEINLTDGIVGTDIGASVSALSGEARGDIGDENLEMYGEAEVDVLTAEASLQAGSITTDEGEHVVGIQGKAIAAAATGGVEAGFKVFGIEIGVTADGYAGAVGIEGEATIGSDGADFGFGAAEGIGGAIGISIDWSDAALPDWVPDWLQ